VQQSPKTRAVPADEVVPAVRGGPAAAPLARDAVAATPAQATVAATPAQAAADREQVLARQRATAGGSLAKALLAARVARSNSTGPALQRMSIRGTEQGSVVSTAAHNKHVVADTTTHEALAAAGYGPRTFITGDDVLTGAVDDNDHDFDVPAATRSDRFNFNADLPIYQFEKTEPRPAGWAAGQPVAQTHDGEEASCEIGVVKPGSGGGAERIEVTHFKLNF
jgi:hypothetical protein